MTEENNDPDPEAKAIVAFLVVSLPSFILIAWGIDALLIVGDTAIFMGLIQVAFIAVFAYGYYNEQSPDTGE